MPLVPTRVFLTKGVGHHKEELRSFELALRKAGIEKCNLVTVSSILPPNCKLISRKEGLKHLHPGEITFVVMSRQASSESRRLLVASVGLAMPADKSHYGYISEHHTFGQTAHVAGDYAEDLAAAMLASTLGIEFDADRNWDEKREVYRASGKIFKTDNITQSAVIRNGGYTTVMAAAVLLF